MKIMISFQSTDAAATRTNRSTLDVQDVELCSGSVIQNSKIVNYN